MGRRAIILSAALILFVLVATGFVALRARTDSSINPENLSRIVPGMTRAEVDEVLRGPPRDDRTRMVFFDLSYRRSGEFKRGEKGDIRAYPEWICDTFCIKVSFDATNRVVSAIGVPPVPPPWYREMKNVMKLVN